MANATNIELPASVQMDSEIREKQKEVRYDQRDFTIDYIVKEYATGLFFIPPYQREFVWDLKRQCRFIESVILGLPIPFMFVADLDDGRLEIVDGAQRIQSLESFINGDLQLKGLEQLATLNGKFFSDLPESQRRKFGTKALRIIVLEDSTSLATRQEIFNRINTSALRAKGAETRRGAFAGPFADFIKKCAANSRFLALCPISKMSLDRREDEELVLRFFAYSDQYKEFSHDVEKFLGKYQATHQKTFDKKTMEKEFDAMLAFVERYFPYGFGKSKQAKSTPRVRFEAIAIGVNLALRKKSNLTPPPVLGWIDSKEFEAHTTTHASNSGPRLRSRIEFVRNKVLGHEKDDGSNKKTTRRP